MGIHGIPWEFMRKTEDSPDFRPDFFSAAPSFSVPPVCPCPGDSDSPPGEP